MKKPRPTPLWKAESLDIIMAAGGPMGSPIETNWTRYFKTLEAAMKACERDYRATGGGETIKWERECSTFYTSGDLGHVQYDITTLKIES